MGRFVFRAPRFPIICDADRVLIAATSLRDFAKQVTALDLPSDLRLRVVDVSGEDWVFLTDCGALSPLTFRGRWTKKAVIALFNASHAAAKLGTQYSERSLAAKRFDRIFTEIVALIQAARKVP